MRPRLMIFGLALSAALTTMGPANATSFCQVRQTNDGFVALRDGPDAGARLLVRMKPGEEVMLGQERRGVWRRVTWWPEGVRTTDQGFNRGGRVGWVHGRLIDDCG